LLLKLLVIPMGSFLALINHEKYKTLCSLNEIVGSNLTKESLNILEMAILDIKLENKECEEEERFDVRPFEYAVSVYKKVI